MCLYVCVHLEALLHWKSGRVMELWDFLKSDYRMVIIDGFITHIYESNDTLHSSYIYIYAYI